MGLKRAVTMIITTLILFVLVEFGASAESYSHWYTRNERRSVYTKSVFSPTFDISGSSLGLSYAFEGLNDVFCFEENIYLLCGDLSLITVLDQEYRFLREIEIVDKTGTEIQFAGANGIFVDDAGLYIADTEGARVLVCSAEGVLEHTITVPESELIPDTFIFKPTKVTKDGRGYVYILSKGSYYGALLLDKDYVFLGFHGAVEVRASVTDVMESLWDQFITTNTQRGKQQKKLPYQFANFYTAPDGFIYTCTGATNLWSISTGQIRMLSPSGLNILYRYNLNGTVESSTSFNFGEKGFLTRNQVNKMQSFCDLAIDDNGFIYAVDAVYGHVYLYDSQCRLLSAFGGGFGEGDTIGTFSLPTALALNGNDLLVSDSRKKTMTVFSLTDFGEKLLTARKLSINGENVEAAELWQEILDLDANCQAAYSSLAMAYYEKGEYQTALSYAKEGEDFDSYDRIYEKMSKDFIKSNLLVLILGALLLLGLVIFAVYMIRKKSKKPNPKYTLPFRLFSHPFDSFKEIKYKDQGSILIGVIITAVYYFISVIAYTNSGFLFSTFTPSSFNALFVLAQTVGLIGLWTLVNWAVCLLFEGKGRLKELFCVATYSIVPLIAYNLLFVVLSNVLPSSASVFLTGLKIIAMMLTVFLLIIGTITVHEYSFKKFVFTTIVTIIGMILFVFVVFILAILIQQFISFFVTIYFEATYR